MKKSLIIMLLAASWGTHAIAYKTCVKGGGGESCSYQCKKPAPFSGNYSGCTYETWLKFGSEHYSIWATNIKCKYYTDCKCPPTKDNCCVPREKCLSGVCQTGDGLYCKLSSSDNCTTTANRAKVCKNSAGEVKTTMAKACTPKTAHLPDAHVRMGKYGKKYKVEGKCGEMNSKYPSPSTVTLTIIETKGVPTSAKLTKNK